MADGAEKTGKSNQMAVRSGLVKRYESKGGVYTYHRPTGARLPDLPLDDPRMIEAIRAVEKNTATQSTAAEIWGGGVAIPSPEIGLAEMAPPAAPHVVAFSVPQIIRFVFRASKGDVIYYHHGNLLEDSRRDPHIRQKGRYIALCVSLGLLAPRQRRAFASETHYFASKTGESAAAPGMPRHALDGSITPDEYEALHAIDARQASVSTQRAIRDALGISDADAVEMRNNFIRRGWLTNGRPPEITDLGEKVMN